MNEPADQTQPGIQSEWPADDPVTRCVAVMRLVDVYAESPTSNHRQALRSHLMNEFETPLRTSVVDHMHLVKVLVRTSLDSRAAGKPVDRQALKAVEKSVTAMQSRIEALEEQVAALRKADRLSEPAQAPRPAGGRHP